MTQLQENLDNLTRVLTSYAGRDKFVRCLSFFLTLKAQTSPNKDALLSLAKQCSAARLLLTAESTDSVDYACSATVTGVYTVYGFVELFAWLSDAKVLAMDAARLYRWCLYLWIVALIAGIIRQIRIISKKGWEKANDDILTLVGLASDFVAAPREQTTLYYCINVAKLVLLSGGSFPTLVFSLRAYLFPTNVSAFSFKECEQCLGTTATCQ
ncbi:hypothetical protein ANCCEY_07289 [Ancylostoma ceylanicum]|uniref:Uncharacterized protein n=1 Tax=Ancylostoma ceylanicum TaxID=53326 RepID=A0A0D6LQY0_9BILA|nr:hypothetical protein ANCCEY_07289 [Ancylostoma ceylanicum]